MKKSNPCEESIVELKKYIVTFRDDLFEIKKQDLDSKKTEELYNKITKLLTDIIFIFISSQRGLKQYNLMKLSGESLFNKVKLILEVDLNQNIDEISNEKNLVKYLDGINNYFIQFKDKEDIDSEILGCLVEDSWQKDDETSTASKNKSSKTRRTNGSYYTDTQLTNVLVNSTLDPCIEPLTSEEILNIKILDPAVGSGKFLIAALKRVLYHLSNKYKESELGNSDILKLKRKIVENCLFGVDLNGVALHAAAYMLWIEIGDSTLVLDRIRTNLIEGDSLLSSYYDLETADMKDKEKLHILDVSNQYFVAKLLNGEKNYSLEKAYNEVAKYLNDNDWFAKNKDYIVEGKKSKAFIWNVKFPNVFIERGGFDVVIGNPPWNKIKAHIKEFFVHFDSEIKNLQGDKLKKYVESKFLSKNSYNELWTEHVNYQKVYSNAISNSGNYKNQSFVVNDKNLSGDRDLYKYFVELAFKLVKMDGYVGLILPASLLQSEGATGLRVLLLDNAQIELLYTIENRERLFPIDSRFKFSLIVFRKGKGCLNAIKCKFMLKSINEAIRSTEERDYVLLTKEFINKVSPHYQTFPEVKTDFERKLIEKIYDKFPLINSDNGWQIQFLRELDMTNDSNLFIHRDEVSCPEDGYLPLYEGRMVHQFDYCRKKYIKGEGRLAEWQTIDWANKEIQPHFYVNKDDIATRNIIYNRARPCYCDIAGQTNERAVQTTILPANVVAGNKVPTIKISNESIASNLLWVSFTNSFVVDWLMRQRMSTTINFFHWSQIPLPKINEKSQEAKTLIINAARLCLNNKPMKEVKQELLEFYCGEIDEYDIRECIDVMERQHIRAEIDAVVAKIYNLEIHELAYILKQFPLVDRGQKAIALYNQEKVSEAKSTITRDLVLKKYLEITNDNLHTSINEVYKKCGSEPYNYKVLSIAERVESAQELGAIAYIPG